MQEKTPLSLELGTPQTTEALETASRNPGAELDAARATLRGGITRWLPLLAALAVVGIGLIVLPRLLDYTQHSWRVLNFGWQLDFDEGINLNASHLLAQGKNIYRPNPPDHFVSSMYPPLYFALNAAAIKLWGLSLWSGRLLALLGALSVGALLWTWVYAETRRHAAGALAALLWFSLGPVYVWSTFYKQDMPALALGLLGGAYFGFWNAPIQNPKSKIQNAYWAILPLALSFWMKQSSLAVMGAVGLWLLLRDWRFGLRWGLLAGASIVVPFAVLDLALRGGLHEHVLAFDHYGRSLTRLGKNMGELWASHWPLVMLGVGCLLVAVALSMKERRVPPLSALYLLVATPATLLSNTLPTANYNHLLDILAPLCLMSGVAFGWVWRAWEERGLQLRWALPVAGVLLLAAAQATLTYAKPGRAWYTPLGIPFEERAAQMEKIDRLVASTPGDILSEDNWLLLKNGKRVLYDDPAAMAALARTGAWDQSLLLDDLNRRKFSLVLLQYDLSGETYNPRWSDEALAALKANYETRFRDVLFVHVPRPPERVAAAIPRCWLGIGNGPVLEGYTFRAAAANRGDNLPLSLYWARGGEWNNVKYFVRLLDGAGAPQWGVDLVPGEVAGKPYTAGWQGGERVRDDLSIPVKEDLPYGRYRLAFGAYRVVEGEIQRVGLACGGDPLPVEPDGSATLGNIEVVERWGK